MDVSTIDVEDKVKKNEEDCVLSVRNLHTSFFTDAGEGISEKPDIIR